MSDGEGFAVGLILLICAAGCIMLGCSMGEDHYETLAIEHGVGEYYIDKDGDKAFRWITEKESEVERCQTQEGY